MTHETNSSLIHNPLQISIIFSLCNHFCWSHPPMAMVILTTLLVIFVTVLLKVAYDTISCYWLTPMRIRKIMERQGVHGPKPRFLIGNIIDMTSLVSRAVSQDMKTINHDIVGRLLPHFVAWSNQYGISLFLLLCTHI